MMEAKECFVSMLFLLSDSELFLLNIANNKSGRTCILMSNLTPFRRLNLGSSQLVLREFQHQYFITSISSLCQRR
jgi:hypothetical protein